MSQAQRFFVLLAAFVLMIGFNPVSAFADSPAIVPGGLTCVYVRDAGHNIHGAFLDFYASHNGVENFGAPLTEAFREDGFIVQYFERARLEFHPENPELYRVQLGLLVYYDVAGGKVMDERLKDAAIPPANTPGFLYFPDTGLTTSFAIKDYFESHGGVDVFGFPISLLRYEGGNFVQYFQRQRLAWNPADPSASKVQPSSVGQTVLDRKYPPNFQWRVRAVNDWCPEVSFASWRPKPLGITPTLVVPPLTPSSASLGLQVYVRFKQTGLTGPQYVEVQVYDPSGKPFAGAALSALVRFTNNERVFALITSDAQGKSSFQFDIGTQPAGSITEVEVTAMAGGFGPGNGRDRFSR